MASEFYSGQLIFMSNLPSGQVAKKVKLHHCVELADYMFLISTPVRPVSIVLFNETSMNRKGTID
jgi:hypothetical protein